MAKQKYSLMERGTTLVQQRATKSFSRAAEDTCLLETQSECVSLMDSGQAVSQSVNVCSIS